MSRLLIGGLACILFFLIIGSEAALGLGVSPGRVTLKYASNETHEGYIHYTPGGVSRLKISSGGEFPQNIELINVEEDNIFYADNGSLHYKFTMPADIKGLGTHRTTITAVEAPEEEASGGIFAVIAVEFQIDVHVPYCGDGNVDAGEECDSSSPCCDLTNCKFTCNGASSEKISCYQEFANKPESCGALGDGTESADGGLGTEAGDGDWSSGTTGHFNTGAALNMVYHKPANAIQEGTKLVFNQNPNELDYRHYASIPLSCWNYDADRLYLSYRVYDRTVHCYDGTGIFLWPFSETWTPVTGMDTDYLLETGMDWSIGVECTDSDCYDNNVRTIDTCSDAYSCQHKRVPYCGDSDVDAEEVCDEGDLNGQPNHCNAQCSGIEAEEMQAYSRIPIQTVTSSVPEFSTITLGVAILCIGLGLVLLRKH